MKKVFRFKNLGCANCAAKMENKIKKIKGVTSVSIDFLFQKMFLEAEENEFAQILDEAARICKKIEPDCEIIR